MLPKELEQPNNVTFISNKLRAGDGGKGSRHEELYKAIVLGQKAEVWDKLMGELKSAVTQIFTGVTLLCAPREARRHEGPSTGALIRATFPHQSRD